MIVKPFSQIVSDTQEKSQESLKPFTDAAEGGIEIDESDNFASTCRENSSQKGDNIFTKSFRFLGSFLGLLTVLAGFMLVALLLDAIQTIETLFSSPSPLDTFYLIALITLLGSFSIFSYRNYREIKTLKDAKKVQDFFAQQKQSPTKELIGETLNLLYMYAQTPNKKLQEKAKLLESRISSSHEYKEIYRELDEEVLHVIDKEVQTKIKTASIQAAISTAISPLALLDAAIVVWRSVKLTKEIAKLYGFKPSLFSTIMLLKQGAFNVFFAGATELALEYTNELAENSLLSKLSTSAAQGLSNGILLARVAYGVMQACRPLPLKIKRKSFMKEIYLSIKDLLLSSKTNS